VIAPLFGAGLLGIGPVAALPFDDLDPEASLAVVVAWAVNLEDRDLDRLAAGLELAVAPRAPALAVVRIRPPEVPATCGTTPECAETARERLGVDEVWFLVAARVGTEVRFEGVRWDGTSEPIEPFIVDRAALEEPAVYGAPTGPAALPAAPEDPAPTLRLGTWILGGVAAGALATGIGFGLAALATRNALDDDGCAGGGCDPGRVDRLEGRARVADVAFGVAAATAVGAVAFELFAPRRAVDARVGAQLSADGLQLTLEGRF